MASPVGERFSRSSQHSSPESPHGARASSRSGRGLLKGKRLFFGEENQRSHNGSLEERVDDFARLLTDDKDDSRPSQSLRGDEVSECSPIQGYNGAGAASSNGHAKAIAQIRRRKQVSFSSEPDEVSSAEETSPQVRKKPNETPTRNALASRIAQLVTASPAGQTRSHFVKKPGDASSSETSPMENRVERKRSRDEEESDEDLGKQVDHKIDSRNTRSHFFRKPGETSSSETSPMENRVERKRSRDEEESDEDLSKQRNHETDLMNTRRELLFSNGESSSSPDASPQQKGTPKRVVKARSILGELGIEVTPTSAQAFKHLKDHSSSCSKKRKQDETLTHSFLQAFFGDGPMDITSPFFHKTCTAKYQQDDDFKDGFIDVFDHLAEKGEFGFTPDWFIVDTEHLVSTSSSRNGGLKGWHIYQDSPPQGVIVDFEVRNTSNDVVYRYFKKGKAMKHSSFYPPQVTNDEEALKCILSARFLKVHENFHGGKARSLLFRSEEHGCDLIAYTDYSGRLITTAYPLFMNIQWDPNNTALHEIITSGAYSKDPNFSLSLSQDELAEATIRAVDDSNASIVFPCSSERDSTCVIDIAKYIHKTKRCPIEAGICVTLSQRDFAQILRSKADLSERDKDFLMRSIRGES